MTEKLLPCPFCGGKARLIHNSTGWWNVGCHDTRCIAAWNRAPSRHTEAEAITAWNTRAERTCCDVCADVAEFTCSACNFNCDLTSWTSLFDGDDGRHRHHHHGTPNYCPDCGAKVVKP